MRSSSVCLSISLALTAATGQAAIGQEPTQEQPAQEQPAPPDDEAEAAKSEAEPKPLPRPVDAAELFTVFANLPGLELHYTEHKHLALLAVPLASKGRLYFLQPGYLARLVEAPEESKLLISPSELRMSDRDGVEVIDLHQSDRLRLFVTSLVQVLRGDRDALTKLYTIDYTTSPSDPAAWTVTLKPQAKPLTQMLQSLKLNGSARSVTKITVVEPNGDRTVTTVTKAVPRTEFTATEKTELFDIQPKKAR